MTPRTSPLDAQHRALGAKLVPFGGWDMPLAYEAGTLSEHRACRSRAVVFDVSHLGTVRLEGADAYQTLQGTLTNDLAKVGPGRAQYTHLLDDDGGVLDDIIVWWVAGDPGDPACRMDVMPNASNTSRVVAAIGGTDVTASRAILAVQGPEARDLVAPVIGDAARVPHFAVQTFTWRGAECVVAGTGYTGEDGIEIAVPSDTAPALWEAVLAADIPPAGLGARDTLRLEAGLPLHGHELGRGITPLQAGLGWVVGWDKPAFSGKDALVAERAAGVRRRLRGLRCVGRQPPREGYVVRSTAGDDLGAVTSGNFSPVLECGIAMAFLPPALELSTEVMVEARGRSIGATVTGLPFYKAGK